MPGWFSLVMGLCGLSLAWHRAQPVLGDMANGIALVAGLLAMGVFGVLLVGGVLRGKALLKTLLEAAFEGLNDAGWMKLSRNWGWFFFALAALNEVLRRQLDFGDWIAAKLWVFLPLTFLFTFIQIPMLLRHGLGVR